MANYDDKGLRKFCIQPFYLFDFVWCVCVRVRVCFTYKIFWLDARTLEKNVVLLKVSSDITL